MENPIYQKLTQFMVIPIQRINFTHIAINSYNTCEKKQASSPNYREINRTVITCSSVVRTVNYEETTDRIPCYGVVETIKGALTAGGRARTLIRCSKRAASASLSNDFAYSVTLMEKLVLRPVITNLAGTVAKLFLLLS